MRPLLQARGSSPRDRLLRACAAVAAATLWAGAAPACGAAAEAASGSAAASPAGPGAGSDAAARRFVEAHPVWRVSGDPAWRPYSFRGADGKMAGLDVEFARVLAERVGVRAEWVDVPSWPEALRRFRAGELDVLMGTARTPERDGDMLFTEPYAASPVAVIARLEFPFLVTLRDLRGQTVAAPAGHVTTEFLQRHHPEIRLAIHPDLDSALRAVSEGRADAMVAGLVASATTIRSLGLQDLKVAGLVDMRFDLCAAVRPDWPQARALLDAAIAADPPEVRVERFDRWLAPILGLQRQAWRWRGLFLAGLGVAGALAAGLLGVVTWNRVLKARVARATAELREEAVRRGDDDRRFRAIFDQAPIGMFRSTPEGQFLSVNPYLARMFGWDAPERMVADVNRGGIAATIFEDAGQRSRIVASVLDRPGGLVASEVRYRARDGRPIDALLSMTALADPASGRPTLIGFVQDVTERAREEAIRRQRERLAALGQMAGGVAHDFNNLLAVVQTEAELLADARPGDEVVAETVRRLGGAAAGGRALTGRLLRFVRTRPGEVARPYDAHDALRAAMELFEAVGGRHVRVVTAPAASGSRVTGFREDLQNALLNLCLNARDAMPDGGTLTVTTRDADLGPGDRAALAPYAPEPGRHLAIDVADTGTGMTAEALASCREPFFTTKGAGGTGLGLWMVHCFVAGQGGAMAIASRPGEGTRVTLYLPVAAAA